MGGATVRRSKDPLPRPRPPAIAAVCCLFAAAATALLAGERTASDLEREEFLKRGAIGQVKVLSVGVTEPLRATLSYQGQTHYAHIQRVNTSLRRFRTSTRTYANFRDCYRYNIAAYRLDRLLGLDMVPVSVERHYRGKPAAVTWWVDDVLMSDAERYQEEIPPPDMGRWLDQRYQSRIFNQLICNEDPNLGNLLIDQDWRLIDFTRAFRRHHELQEPRAIEKVDRRLYEGLQALDLEGLERETAPYLTKQERNAILARRDKILEILDQRIATYGEAAIVCDLPGH